MDPNPQMGIKKVAHFWTLIGHKKVAHFCTRWPTYGKPFRDIFGHLPDAHKARPVRSQHARAGKERRA